MPPNGPPANDHPVVSALTSSDETPPDTIVFVGFNGRSPDGRLRLYLNPDLSEWLDLADSDVVHHTEGLQEGNQLTPSALWVNRDAPVEYGFRPRPTDFLRGDILRSALEGATGLTADTLMGMTNGGGTITPTPIFFTTTRWTITGSSP